MVQEQKQIDSRLLWGGGILLIIVVFFVARALTREHLTVRAALAVRAPLVSTVSTNGRVEPENNIEFHSPTNTTVKALYVQPGDVVSAGKLLIELDDLPARAKVATAESGVKAAQASYEATLHSGTNEEQLSMAAELTKAKLDRDQAKRDLEAREKLKASGAVSSSEVAAAQDHLSAAESNLKSIEDRTNHRYSNTEIERAKAALNEAETNLLAARRVLEQTSFRAPVAGTVYSIDVSKTQYAEEGKTLLQMADLKQAM
jgi:HlyD family secretion protein